MERREEGKERKRVHYWIRKEDGKRRKGEMGKEMHGLVQVELNRERRCTL